MQQSQCKAGTPGATGGLSASALRRPMHRTRQRHWRTSRQWHPPTLAGVPTACYTGRKTKPRILCGSI